MVNPKLYVDIEDEFGDSLVLEDGYHEDESDIDSVFLTVYTRAEDHGDSEHIVGLNLHNLRRLHRAIEEAITTITARYAH